MNKSKSFSLNLFLCKLKLELTSIPKVTNQKIDLYCKDMISLQDHKLPTNIRTINVDNNFKIDGVLTRNLALRIVGTEMIKKLLIPCLVLAGSAIVGVTLKLPCNFCVSFALSSIVANIFRCYGFRFLNVVNKYLEYNKYYQKFSIDNDIRTLQLHKKLITLNAYYFMSQKENIDIIHRIINLTPELFIEYMNSLLNYHSHNFSPICNITLSNEFKNVIKENECFFKNNFTAIVSVTCLFLTKYDNTYFLGQKCIQIIKCFLDTLMLSLNTQIDDDLVITLKPIPSTFKSYKTIYKL